MAEFQKLNKKRQLTNGRDRRRRILFDVDFSRKGLDFDGRRQRPFFSHNGFTRWVKHFRR